MGKPLGTIADENEIFIVNLRRRASQPAEDYLSSSPVASAGRVKGVGPLMLRDVT